jgi:hypothetical protein
MMQLNAERRPDVPRTAKRLDGEILPRQAPWDGWLDGATRF